MRSPKYERLRRFLLTACVISGLLGWCGAAHLTARPPTRRAAAAAPENASDTAKYRIEFVSLKPLKLRVTADIPIEGKMLEMDNTYPAELPEMAAKGWPALVSNLVVTDAAGKMIEWSPAGTKGWQLTSPIRSRLRLSYDVDYSLFASNGWSSPLESVFADEENAIVAGRSVFITTAHIRPVEVGFAVPRGWIPVMPWPEGGSHRYNVRSNEDLIDNMLVFSKNKPDLVKAAGFKLQTVLMGHWRPLRLLVHEMLKTIITREVALMNFKEKEIYNVVLLPIQDEGGNAFRQSFAYCFNGPNPSNRGVWANTLAHEIFHYWNYARLKGANYASSQWFQEGFTEYVANLILMTGKSAGPGEFLNKLSRHVNNYRKLTTTLENYETHKGPPLYSAGALVAFIWDIKIRMASGGKRNIGDMFRNLMAQTDSGRRQYTWSDIRAALQASAAGDWEGFYQAHIRGHEPLPLDQIMPLAGLRLKKMPDGKEEVERDPAASTKARAFWRSYLN